jgi:serine/threonine-protein kinase HipA
MSEVLEVWLDSDQVPMTLVGTLAQEHGIVRFRYDRPWLGNPARFALDPDLALHDGMYFPNAKDRNFGIFLDSAPDRWGQTLMKRREALAARDEKRPARTLYAWDYLIGVQDFTRQGALRVRRVGTEEFLGAEKFAAPPVTSLRELEEVALKLTSKRIDDLDALRKWLSVLVAPGASLGGARPKANFTQADGSLWIAKFPSRDDDRDVGGWEFIVHKLAQDAGIDVPPARIARLGNGYHTFCSKRFDREKSVRKFYASAMTLLRKEESEGTSYLELAQFLRQQGSPRHVREGLHELFRRVLFNVGVGNRDDHLRNHGFIHSTDGWRLAPAFDINSNLDKADHVLNIDDADNRPSIELVMQTPSFYDLSPADAARIKNRVLTAIDRWPHVAKANGMSDADIAIAAPAFQAHADARANR